MRLLRLADVGSTPSDRVFFYSRIRALLFGFTVLGAAGWILFYSTSRAWKPGYYIAAAVLLFLELIRRFVTARFRPSNWLVRMNDLGLFIQFRSYLNYHLPAEDLTVVFIGYEEIRSARLVRERVSALDNQGGTSTQTVRYVELELAGDIAPLTRALQSELTEKAPIEKRWYGRSSTLYEDHPVRMVSPPFLQIRWQIVPRTQKFLDALRPYTTIADPVFLSRDFAHLESLSREEQQQRLREMAERGETVTAMYTARKLYGCGLAEAKQMVNGIADTQASAAKQT